MATIEIEVEVYCSCGNPLGSSQMRSKDIEVDPGEDKQLEKVYSRKQVKNILNALKAKRTLTHIIIPRSKSKRIELFLPASKIGEISFPNSEKGSINFPNKERMGCSVSPITALGKTVEGRAEAEAEAL